VSDVKRADVYLFGDSHAASISVPPGSAPACFNFGYGADSFFDMNQKVSYLIREGYLREGGTVVVEVDLHLFSDYREQLNNNDISGIYNNSPNAWINLAFPLWGDKRVLSPQYLLKPPRKPDMKKVVSLQSRGDTARFRSRLRQQLWFDFHLNALAFDDLQELMDSCDANNIRFIAVVYPLHPLYKQLIGSVVNYDKLMAQVKAQVGDHDFLDLSDSLKQSKYFRDQDHLNAAGSEAFLDLVAPLLSR